MSTRPPVMTRTVPVVEMDGAWVIVNRETQKFVRRKTALSAFRHINRADERKAAKADALVVTIIEWKPKTAKGRQEVEAITSGTPLNPGFSLSCSP